MKQLSSYMVLSIDGGDRISYKYNEIDDKTGNIISMNNSGNFFVLDSEVQNHIEAVREFIKREKLEG